MSLVQPTRAPNANGNNVGVKRPFQLMINNAAYVATSDGPYSSRAKNIKLDKEVPLEDINEDNLVCYFTWFKSEFPKLFLYVDAFHVG